MRNNIGQNFLQKKKNIGQNKLKVEKRYLNHWLYISQIPIINFRFLSTTTTLVEQTSLIISKLKYGKTHLLPNRKQRLGFHVISESMVSITTS